MDPATEPPGTAARRHVLRPVQLRLPGALPRPAAPDERRVVITDDFGQRIQMSLGQLADLVADARAGVLDEVLGACGS